LIGVAWEKQLGTLEEGKSYKISSASVTSFNDAKYISVGERSNIEVKDDIGNVVGGELVFDESGDAKVVREKS